MNRWYFCWALAAACHAAPAAQAHPPPESEADTVTKRPALPQGRVTVRAKSGPAVFAVELALDAPNHERGLMYRRAVPEGTGMLFVFPAEEPKVFWMKNTLVPLDMIFLSSAQRVVGVIENAEPLTTTPRDPHASAQYVLEVAGGTAFARGIHVGDVVELEGVPKP